MRTFWIILALLACAALCVIYFFENLPKMVHNVFYKTKFKLTWRPDMTEDYY